MNDYIQWLIQAGALGLLGLVLWWQHQERRKEKDILVNHLGKTIKEDAESRERLTIVLTEIRGVVSQFQVGCSDSQVMLKDTAYALQSTCEKIGQEAARLIKASKDEE